MIREDERDDAERSDESDVPADADEGSTRFDLFDTVADEESGEPDPEAGLLPDESELFPGGPEIEIPKAPEPPDPSAASKELRRDFWGLVIVINIALFGVTVRPMFVAFRGNWEIGGALFALGAVATVHGLYRYRKVRRRHD